MVIIDKNILACLENDNDGSGLVCSTLFISTFQYWYSSILHAGFTQPIWLQYNDRSDLHGPLTRYVQLRVTHTRGMPGRFSRHWLQRKPLVSDPSMHHGTCVTHVPWCMSGSLTRGGGENIPGSCATRKFTYLVSVAFVTHVTASCRAIDS